MSVESWFDHIEDTAEDIVTGVAVRAAPWLMDLPVAYLAGYNIVKTFGWPVWLGILAGGGTELLGLACTGVALRFRDYNIIKRQADPPAPSLLAWAMVGFYFIGSLVLALLNTFTGLRIYALLVFPMLGAVGTFTHAMSLDHRRRLEEIASRKAETAERARATRAQRVAQSVAQPVAQVAQGVAGGSQPSNRDAILAIYRNNAYATADEVAQSVGITRQAVSKWLPKLEKAGAIRRNGHGVEVL